MMAVSKRERGMSESKRRRRRQQQFLVDNPWCCFCGGTTPATTVDHVPARTCFKGRAFPETFEFPACAPCNNASRLDEIAFSFFVKMIDHTHDNFEGSEAERTISGMANNLPHLLPIPSRDGRRNRDSLNRMGLQKPRGRVFSELPMAAIPHSAHEPIKRYARKIACALHYREKGRPASATHQMVANRGQLLDRPFMESVEGFLTMPNLQVGNRRNVNFGNQFAYRYIGADDPDVFGVIAQFGTGMVIASMVVEQSVAERLLRDGKEIGFPEDHEPWISVMQNYELLTEA